MFNIRREGHLCKCKLSIIIKVKAFTFKRVRMWVTRKFQKQGKQVDGLNKNYVRKQSMQNSPDSPDMSAEF